MSGNNYRLEFDGSCWPNPHGIAGFGWILYQYEPETKSEIKSGYGVAGVGQGMSNNYAEYFALCEGLEYILSLNLQNVYIDIFGDSLMVIKQLNAKKYRNQLNPFKGNTCLYVPQARRAFDLVRSLKDKGIEFTFNWNARDANQACDDLSKKALPEATLGSMKKFSNNI